MSIKIVVDSTSNIDVNYIKEHDIQVVSLGLLINDEPIREVEIKDYKQYYQKMKDGDFFLKTSQPSIMEYEEIMKKEVANGNEVIVVTLGSVFSGTYSCACLAKQNVGSDNVYVVDSGQLTCGIRLLVEEIVKMKEQNKSCQEIVDECPKIIERIHLYFVPNSLKYLRKGGRIGLINSIFGSILQIKPILHVSQNLMDVKKKVMGFLKAMAESITFLPQKIKKLIFMNIAQDEQTKESYREQIKSKGYKIDDECGDISLVVASHLGPAIGVAILTE